MPKLDPNKVPLGLRKLLPMAERWGIADDFDWERALRGASRLELEELAQCLDDITDDKLEGWLTGPASDKEEPLEEFLALTNPLMAFYSAKIKLRKDDGNQSTD